MLLRVARIQLEAHGIKSFELRHPDGAALPAFTAGAHVHVNVVTPDGKAQLMPLKGTINQLSRVIDLVPDALAKLAALRKGSKDSPAEIGSGEPEPDRKRKHD